MSQYLTAADVSRIYRWSPAYVYKQARTHRWSRFTLDGKVRYRRDQVQATFDAGRVLAEVKSG